jgi:hypothetical protein
MMATPEKKPSSSNSMAVLVMFLAVLGTAGVLYATLDETAPQRQAAYAPLPRQPVTTPVAAHESAPADNTKPLLLTEPDFQVHSTPPVVPPPGPKAVHPKAHVKPVAKKPRAVPVQLQAKASKPTPPVRHQRAPSPDELLQAEVMGAIRRTENLHGSISVNTKDGVVHLNGWTITPGEAYRAALAARRVKDVKQVQSEIRPRMTGPA